MPTDPLDQGWVPAHSIASRKASAPAMPQGASFPGLAPSPRHVDANDCVAIWHPHRSADGFVVLELEVAGIPEEVFLFLELVMLEVLRSCDGVVVERLPIRAAVDDRGIIAGLSRATCRQARKNRSATGSSHRGNAEFRGRYDEARCVRSPVSRACAAQIRRRLRPWRGPRAAAQLRVLGELRDLVSGTVAE